uniref:mannose-1-phosphate guanylyltransferase n=1 Tax=candidate division WOR-3 bacterium TaxID=2052148 RepID=A0A7C4GEE4_UNCW3
MATHAVILCGGRGERFWPASRRKMPKQFIRLFGTKSLTRQTSERISGICPRSRQLFITPNELASLVAADLRLPRRNLLLEPCGRNTAPAIALAAIHLSKRDPDGVMVVLPADHLITRRREFHLAVRLAIELARRGLLATFGIPPSRPDTGYGYIRYGRRLAGSGRLTAHEVAGFQEKPDNATARRYLREKTYLWNSGMFVWRVDAIMTAFRLFLPEFHSELVHYGSTIGTSREPAALQRLYRKAPSISIDYAVMERAENIAVVKANFDWDDVGSWLALTRHLPADRDGNVRRGTTAVKDTSSCVIDSGSGLVACLGVRDLVIVRSGEAVLVAHKDALGGIKDLLAQISRQRGGESFL